MSLVPVCPICGCVGNFIEVKGRGQKEPKLLGDWERCASCDHLFNSKIGYSRGIASRYEGDYYQSTFAKSSKSTWRQIYPTVDLRQFESAKLADSGLRLSGELIRAITLRRVAVVTPPGTRLLELGSATGEFARVLGRMNPHSTVIASDFSKSGVELTAAQWTPAMRCDAVKLPIRDESIDVVVMYHLIEHLFDPLSALTEAKRTLKEGGLVVGAVPSFQSLTGKFLGTSWDYVRDPTHLHLFSRQSLLECARRAGLTCNWLGQRQTGWNLLPSPRDPRVQIRPCVRRLLVVPLYVIASFCTVMSCGDELDYILQRKES